ncbi:MAG: hypothetical protein NXI22_18785 [bacterium]|nr:hypothetical protein [bacterium]
MLLFVSALAALAVSAPSVHAPREFAIAECSAGDVFVVEMTGRTIEMELINPKTGEVLLRSDQVAKPVHAFVNGSTQGAYPEMFVRMGVLREGLRLELVQFNHGDPGADAGRFLTPRVERIAIR